MAISSALGGTIGAVPAGAVMPFAGANAPSGWLLCAGQAVSRTQYSGLFLTLGTTYGAGDGSTTFNLPDLRGRVVAGLDNMGGTAASRLTATTITGGGDNLGEVGGAQTHTLSTAEMPSHNHPLYGAGGGGGVPYRKPLTYSGDNYVSPLYEITTGMSNTGGGGAHNNVQPTIVLNYIIKAG